MQKMLGQQRIIWFSRVESCTVMHAVWLGLAPVELSGQAGDLYRFRIGVRKLCANC